MDGNDKTPLADCLSRENDRDTPRKGERAAKEIRENETTNGMSQIEKRCTASSSVCPLAKKGTFLDPSIRTGTPLARGLGVS